MTEQKIDRYWEFKDRLFKIIKQKNSHRFWAIFPISVALVEKYLPSQRWENRRKKKRPYLRYVPLPGKRTLIIGTFKDKKEFLEAVSPLMDLVDDYWYGRLTKGCSIDDYYLLRREGNRLYLQPHPKQIQQFWWEQEKILNTTKFWKPGHAVFRLNKIRADFYYCFKDVFIPLEQLKAFDRRFRRRFFKWLGSHKIRGPLQQAYWEKVFKFTEAENVYSKYFDRQP